MLDANGKELNKGDSVTVPGTGRMKVIGLGEICNEDVVVLGTASNGSLAHPWCEKASIVEKQK